MPYSSNESLPEYVKKYPEKVQSMWRHTFNSTYSKVLKESGSVKDAETRAFKAASSTIKRRMEKFGMPRYGHEAYFNNMVDSFLNRE